MIIRGGSRAQLAYAFVRDHCFSSVGAEPEQKLGLVGPQDDKRSRFYWTYTVAMTRWEACGVVCKLVRICIIDLRHRI